MATACLLLGATTEATTQPVAGASTAKIRQLELFPSTVRAHDIEEIVEELARRPAATEPDRWR